MSEQVVGGTALPAADAPSVVGKNVTVLGEIKPGDPSTWEPSSYAEWESRERTRTFLEAWSEQVKDERILRRSWSGKVFALIVFQVLAVFGLIVGQGLNLITVDVGLLQVLLPSVLAEVFGLGFLVAKYLFSQSLRHSMDILANSNANQRSD